MSSVSNPPPSGPNTANYTDQQKDVLQSVEEAAQKKGAAAASGDSGELKNASRTLDDLLKQAEKGHVFSKNDFKSIQAQTHQEAVASYIGAQVKAGNVIDDTAAAATLHNDYDRFAKQYGLNASSSDTFNKWKAQITPELQKAGVPDDRIKTALDAAAKYRFPRGLFNELKNKIFGHNDIRV